MYICISGKLISGGKIYILHGNQMQIEYVLHYVHTYMYVYTYICMSASNAHNYINIKTQLNL